MKCTINHKENPMLDYDEILIRVHRDDPAAFIRGNVLYTSLSYSGVDEALGDTSAREQGLNIHRAPSYSVKTWT